MPYPEKLQALLSSLTNRQVDGVNIGPGQAVVVGCAGGGKTRVVCARIARMVQDGLDPKYILAMTFTNQAANEMNERLEGLGVDTKTNLGCRVGTIHSVCRQIVRVESSLFDNMRLDTRNNMNFELKKLVDQYRRKGYISRDRGDIEAIKRFIATCKCSGLSWVFENPFGTNTRAEDFIRNHAILWAKATGVEPRRLLLLFIDLERLRAQKSSYSFDDMQLWAWMLLVTDEAVRKRWRQRWSAIIMDEAQDSSFAQMDIARFLAGLSSCMPMVRELPFAPQIDDGHHSLMLVGDTAQSVYGWRDAHPEALLRYYRAARTTKVHLNTNHRSNATLCDFADKIVQGKSWNVNDKIVSASGERVPGCIKIVDYPSAEAEAVGTIASCMEFATTSSYANTVILSRLNVGLQLAEIECIRNRIRYVKRSAGSFFDSNVCQVILAYLRVAAGKDPQRHWEQFIINRPFRFIAGDFVAKATAAVGKSYTSIVDMMVEMSDQLTARQRGTIRQLQQLMDELTDMADSCRNMDGMRAAGQPIDPAEDIRPGRLIETMVVKTKYLEVIRQQEGAATMDESKLAAISELIRMANMFGTAEDFLVYADRLAIAVQQAGRVGLRVEDKEEQQDALVLSTIHKSKGLEWDHVHLIDVAAGRMPSAMSSDAEEELRLLFVAATRARKTLTISRPDGLPAEPGKITSPPGGASSPYIRLARRYVQGS